MKFSEERPNDGDMIEALFPDGKWSRVEYSNDGVDGSLWQGEDVTDLDEYPDLQWRHIEGEDMSGLLGGLPGKNTAEAATLKVISDVPEELREFLKQFQAEMSADEVEYGESPASTFFVETKPEIAPYLAQQIQLLELGWDVEVMEEEIND